MAGVEVASRRVYVGGLFSSVCEADIHKLIGRFGQVESVDIKQHRNASASGNAASDAISDSSTMLPPSDSVYAFVSLKTCEDRLQKCFKQLGGSFWKGHRLKLQLARESFMSRLSRERQQQQQRPVSRAAQSNSNNASTDASGPRSVNMKTKSPALSQQQVIIEQVLDESKRARRHKEQRTSATDFSATREHNSQQRVVDFTGESCDTAADAAPAAEERCGGLAMFSGIAADGGISTDSHPDQDIVSRLENSFGSCWNDTSSSHHYDLPPRPAVSRDRGSTAFAASVHQSRDRQAEDNERRMKSVDRLRDSLFQRRAIVKQGLQSAISNGGSVNKKIRFTDTEAIDTAPVQTNDDEGGCEKIRHRSLHEDESADNRFKLTPNFQSPKSDGSANRNDQIADGVVSRGELHQQMSILNSIVGRKLTSDARSSSSVKNLNHVRFDPTLDEHKRKYESEQNTDSAATAAVADNEATENINNASHQPSHEIFADLSALFGRSRSNSQQQQEHSDDEEDDSDDVKGFSILKMMGRSQKVGSSPDTDQRQPLSPASVRKTERSSSPASSSSSSDDDDDDGHDDFPSKPTGNAGLGDTVWGAGVAVLIAPDDRTLQEGVQFVEGASELSESEKQWRRQQLVELFHTQRRRQKRQQKQQLRHKKSAVRRDRVLCKVK